MLTAYPSAASYTIPKAGENSKFNFRKRLTFDDALLERMVPPQRDDESEFVYREILDTDPEGE